MNILDRILISNTTLIGHDTQNEISVQKLLRFLPSVTLFESAEASEILQHFNSLSHFRDYKLNSLLNDNSINFIVVDLSTIYFNEEKETLPKLAIELTRLFTDEELVLNTSVTRGLDYYEEGLGFEIRTLDNMQIVGGGSYGVGVGFAIGIDRIMFKNN